MHLLISLVTIVALLCQALELQIAEQAKPVNLNPIKGRCAVIVRPGPRRITQLKRTTSDEEYTAIVDDNMYYMALATSYLDSVKIKQVYKYSGGILKFRSTSGKYYTVSLKSLYWDVLLFNGRDKPVEADMTDLDATYRAYMRK